MDRPRHRIVCFAGSCVAIEHDSVAGSPGARIVDFLFDGLPSRAEASPHVTFGIGSDSGGRMVLRRDGAILYQGESEGDLASLLLAEVTHHLADRGRDGVLLHAAAVARRGVAVILPGRTGSGKTTLAAWSTAKGLDYLTDELVLVPGRLDGRQPNQVRPFYRPLTIKATGQRDRERLLGRSPPEDGVLSAAHATLVSPTLLGGVYAHHPTLAVTVFPRFQRGAQLCLEALSKAEADLALMSCVVNARNLPGHGFAQVARLARQVPAFSLVYGEAEEAAATVTVLLESRS